MNRKQKKREKKKTSKRPRLIPTKAKYAILMSLKETSPQEVDQLRKDGFEVYIDYTDPEDPFVVAEIDVTAMLEEIAT